jgi:hypothetical protein
MHSEAGRLGDNLDLIGIEAEPCLHVRAGDGEHRPTGKLRRDRTVHMTSHNSPHLRMTL